MHIGSLLNGKSPKPANYLLTDDGVKGQAYCISAVNAHLPEEKPPGVVSQHLTPLIEDTLFAWAPLVWY